MTASPTAALRASKSGACFVTALLSLTVVISPYEAHAQMSRVAYGTNYFLDVPPAVDLSKLPATARDVVVAQVRVITIFRRGGRHPWDPPQFLIKALRGAEVEILDVLSGKAVKGARNIVYFGVPGSGERQKYPRTPRARALNYFIAFYFDEDNQRHLAGFPVGQEEYEKWYREFLEHERERGRPGARDR